MNKKSNAFVLYSYWDGTQTGNKEDTSFCCTFLLIANGQKLQVVRSLTNQQWEIIINLVCALTNLIGIGPGPRLEAKKYRAELGWVMQWELLLSPAILDWLHIVLIPWHKAQGLSMSPERISASINEYNQGQ